MKNVNSALKIALLNDALRKTLQGGKVLMTTTVYALPPERRNSIIERVQSFDNFHAGNDPFAEHDMGWFDVEGHVYGFKVDYYDRAFEYASPDPTDPSVTTRVLTIMAREDY